VNRGILPEHRGRRTIRGLVAAVVLIGLLLGVPFALATLVGGPSVHLNSGGVWRAALQHRPGDIRIVTGWLGRAAVLLAWIGWAWLTVCVATEIRAWRSGRTAVRLPGSRLLQWVAAVLIGTAFAVGSSGRVPAPRAVPAGIHGTAASDRVVPMPDGAGRRMAGIRVLSDGVPPGGAMPVPDPDIRRIPEPTDVVRAARVDTDLLRPSEGTAPPGADRHRVEPRQTLWSIAEQRLGEARRWVEIAALNYDVIQDDGSRLTADHWIRPGWELVLPMRGDPVVLPGGQSTHRGSVRGVPRVTSSPVAVVDPVAASVPAAATPLDRAGPVPVRVRPVPSPLPIPPVAPFGAGIVGAGVADLVDRLRRVQQRHRAPGERIRPTEPLLRMFEQRLRIGDGRAELDAVEAGVGAWFAGPDPRNAGRRLHQVTVNGDLVRLRFDAPLEVDPDPPFTRGIDPTSVDVRREALVVPVARRRASGQGFAAPTLVSLGRRDGELVLVNLEGVGSLVLDGDRHANESVGRALALELATSRWSGAFDLVLVGFGAGMERCERVTVVAEAGPVTADMTWRRLTTGMRLQELGCPAADVARRSDGATAWQPVVVVCGPRASPVEVGALLDVAEDGRSGIGVVVITGPDTSPPWGRVVLRPRDLGGAEGVEGLGHLVVPQRCDEVENGCALALIDAAADLDAEGRTDRPCVSDDPSAPLDRPASHDPDDVVLAGEGVDREAPGSDVRTVASSTLDARTTVRLDGGAVRAAATAPERSAARPGRAGRQVGRAEGVEAEVEVEVEVAVLGPVEIRGAARGFTRAWAAELVVYLAMHPGGAANEAWATALWPERLMAPSSLHSTASVARRSIGRARDGADHLPRSHGRLQLASTVGTDWDRFLVLAASEDPDRWHDALSMVRGRPFEGSRSTDWSILDGTAPAIESAVVDLSGRLAGARLRVGDARGAEWSARRGLLVSPYDERLYRMLLRAADAAGNPEGVETVMAELVRVVADEIEPIESVHPSTLALYRSLSRRTDRALRAPVRP